MKRPRDTQRKKVYDAEVAALGEPKGGLTLVEAGSYATRIMRSPWWDSTHRTLHAGRFRILPKVLRITDGRGRRRGSARTSSPNALIKLPRFSRVDWYILHELAHVLTARQDEAWHGRTFARAYILLVQRWMGDEAAGRLRAAFAEHGVKYHRQAAKESLRNEPGGRIVGER